MASTSSSTDDTCSCSYSCIAFFGPSVGIAVSARTPAGIFALASSIACTLPVRKYSTTFSAIDAPTLGILRSSSTSIRDTSAWYPPMDRAAFSYTRALNESLPVIRTRSAYSCSSASTSSLGRAMGPSLGGVP